MLARASATSGLVGALLLATSWVITRAAPWGVALAEHLRRGRAPRTDIVEFASQPTTQFETYLVAVTMVGVAVVAFAGLRRVLARYASALDAAAFLAGVIVTWRTSFLFADLSAPAVVVLGAMVSWHAVPAAPTRKPSTIAMCTAFVLVAEAIAAIWAVWLVSFTEPRPVMLALVAVGALALLRPQAARVRDAVAGAPLLLSPLIGLMRSPQPQWVVGLIMAVAILHRFADRPRVQSLLTPGRLAVCGAWCIAAIYSIPCQFRDFGSVNLHDHESGAYAWVNSVFHSKLMMADAGTIYGPLRTYALAAFLGITGPTLEHARIAQIYFNLIALGVLLAIVWSLARQKISVLLWGVYLLFATTYVGHWLDPAGIYAFGWADLGRVAFPLGAAFAGSVMLARRESSPRMTVLLGFLTGLSFFWAQEMSVPVVAALAAAALAEVLLSREQQFLERVRAATRTGGLLALGAVLAAVVFLSPYLLRGRVRAFFSTAASVAKIFASGEYGGLAVQFGPGTFKNWSAATRPFTADVGGRPLEYVLPVAILCVGLAAMIAAALGGGWTARRTRLLALIVFGLAGQRVAFGRADFVHVCAAAVPSALVLCALTADALTVSETDRLPRVLGFAAVAMLVFFSTYATGFERFVLSRTKALVRGDEHPSSSTPYSYPLIPRAGDVYLPPDLERLVIAIRTRTAPLDPIFVRQHPLRGPEIYFLANRRNPTTFDVLCEITHTAQQDQIDAEVRRDPPKMVVGTSKMVGAQLDRYLREQYPVIERFGDWSLAVPR